MSSKFDVEIKNLIKIYEANDNIGPGDASGFASALGSLAKTAYGAVNYFLNFKKFYKHALRQSYKINEEARQILDLQNSSPRDPRLLRRRTKLQYIINELKEDTKKWREYLTPLSTRSAKKSKAALDVIESIINNAEYGNLKKKSNPSKNTLKTSTPSPASLPTP